MDGQSSILLFVLIGVFAGVSAGLFGIGGGVVIVPALVYLAGFTQHRATGTSLAVLLPPIGLGAVLEYYRYGNVDLRAGVVIALSMLLAAWAGGWIANRMSGPALRLAFGVFIVVIGFQLIWSAARRLGWI
jgi:uncharacterized membrane protein YfcA